MKIRKANTILVTGFTVGEDMHVFLVRTPAPFPFALSQKLKYWQLLPWCGDPNHHFLRVCSLKSLGFFFCLFAVASNEPSFGPSLYPTV